MFKRDNPSIRSIPLIWPIGILFVVLAANAFFLKFNAFRIFVPYDMAPYLDAAWRVLCGQRFYVDFIFPEAPLHVEMMVVFFRLFGFTKTAILAHLIVIHSLVIIAVFLMMYRRVPLFITTMVAVLTAPSFYWTVSHPWHDQSAHFWGVLALAVFLREYPCRDLRKILIKNWACGLLTMLSVITKTNIGVMYAGVFFLAALSENHKMKAAGAYLGGILTGLLISLWLIGAPRDFWQQNLLFVQGKLYGRTVRFRDIHMWFSNFYWIPPLVVFINTAASFVRLKTILILFYGICAVAILSLMTGGLRGDANILLWGIQMALAFLVLAQEKIFLRSDWRKRLHLASTVFLLALTLFETITAVHRGIELKAWYRDPGVKDAQYYRLKSEPLSGWLMPSREGWMLDQIVEYIKTQVPSRDTILNLSDFYMIYALTGRESYRGINYAFFEDVFPMVGKQTADIKKHILSHLPDWMIIRVGSFDGEIKALDLAAEIVTLYHPVQQIGDALILKRN
ncbi:MAG TPA: hypothetical protein VJA17_02835 [Candidatus Omnitrophota bacterium]|nr:hypothetical protein [Candidatus Omnitrophota bacterium]